MTDVDVKVPAGFWLCYKDSPGGKTFCRPPFATREQADHHLAGMSEELQAALHVVEVQ